MKRKAFKNIETSELESINKNNKDVQPNNNYSTVIKFQHSKFETHCNTKLLVQIHEHS